jgi:Superinfection immunity protein
MNALANSYFFWIALILALLGLYILPSVIAILRGVESLGWIIVINLLPTGVGWLAALIGALMLPRRQPPPVPSPYPYGPQTYPSLACTSAHDSWPDSWPQE